MAEQPLETEELGTDLPEGLVPPDDISPQREEPDGVSLPPVAETSGHSGPVLLRDRYLIDLSTRIPELDQPSAKAYAVEDRRDFTHKIFALACTPGLPARMDAIKAMQGLRYRGFLPLVEWDVVPWAPLGQSTLVMIYVRPLGGRVVDRLQRKDTRITEYDIPSKVVEPLINGLQFLNEMADPHRAIRPDNLYFLDEDMEQIVLGPHVTAPPGFDQPISFEPIERAMCEPEGRGLGDIRDDIYALAVTFIHLILDNDPVEKVKEDDLIFHRLETGSYNAIFGNVRLPLAMHGPVRSMMADDPSERWDQADVMDWATGEKPSAVKHFPAKKAEVPFRFCKREHLGLTTLAWHFAQHPHDAVRALESNVFVNWIKRYPDSSRYLDPIKEAIQSAKSHNENHKGTDDFLISNVSSLLDPAAPIRYKGMRFMLDGYGPMLAIHWCRRGDPKDAAQILNHEIPAMWFTSREPLNTELAKRQRAFANLKGLLSMNDPGYGLERVVYEINSGFPCQSPMIVKNNVLTIEHLLPAMEEAANSADTSNRPIDRHIAAFIATRFDEDVRPHLKAFASEKTDTSVIGMLSLLALLQWKFRAPSMLALSSWIGGQLGPAINAYHNRHTRDELEKEIPKLVRKGSMPELFNLIDDAEKRREDSDGFREAQEEWLTAEQEIRDIEGAGEERLSRAEVSGQQTAATISVVLGLTVVSVLLIMKIL